MPTETAEFAKAMAASLVADLYAHPLMLEDLGTGRLSRGELSTLLFQDLGRDVSGEGGPVVFPAIRALVRAHEGVMAAQKRAGMGADADPWSAVASVLNTAIGAATNYSISRMATKTQSSLQQSAQQQIADQARIAEAQADIARSQTQAYAATGGGAGAASGGTPEWVTPVAIGGGILVLGGIIYAATRG